jgi:hypothetical protein
MSRFRSMAKRLIEREDVSKKARLVPMCYLVAHFSGSRSTSPTETHSLREVLWWAVPGSNRRPAD